MVDIGKLVIWPKGMMYDEGYWYIYWWNWLPSDKRFWGYETFWYDYPHAMFGLWFINFSWSFPWTKHVDKTE